jgi:hypothetical protein
MWLRPTRSLSKVPCGRQAVLSVLHARRRDHAGTEAQSRMLVSKPRRPPLLREQVVAQSAEPPDTDPYVRWCGREASRDVPYPDSRLVKQGADRLVIQHVLDLNSQF